MPRSAGISVSGADGTDAPGAPLARLVLTIALEELLRRTAGFEVDGPVEYARMPEIGAVSVPLALRPAFSGPHMPTGPA